MLNHWPVGQRIGKRQADLERICARLAHGGDHIQRSIRIGESQWEIRHQCSVARGKQLSKAR
jgi:hypothetical protein